MNAPVIVTRIELWPTSQLILDCRNSRTHSEAQITQLAAGIAEFGFTNPILVGTDRVVIAGNARLSAARRLKLEQVPVIVLDHLSDIQRRALAIADNRLPLDAGWNEEMLRLELAVLRDLQFDLNLTGFDHQELNALLAAEVAKALTDEDSIPDLPSTAITMSGDLWVAGEHRVLCGDTTIRADVDRLMAGETADLVFTDPPYNCDYEGYTKRRLRIQNDRMSPEEFRDFLTTTFRNCRPVLKPDASLYVCHSSSRQRDFESALEAAGIAVRCQIIWAKNTFAWGFGRYKFQHEPIFYCHIAGQKDRWYGDKKQSTLWQENKPVANRDHPMAKPVELVERALLNSSRAGDLIVDLFGGSGTTLIACERHACRARLMEVDPKYTDVIVQRWQQYTGSHATLAGDGRTYAQIAGIRRDTESRTQTLSSTQQSPTATKLVA
jgi:DNA modification methylase